MNDAESSSVPAAVLDACTLAPIRLATTLLWLAEAGVFEVLWSEEILDEVRRTLPKLGLSSERAAHRVDAMRNAFGNAALVSGFDHLIDTLTCDPKDRHVLAALPRPHHRPDAAVARRRDQVRGMTNSKY